jgi:hypothetical protein
MVLHPCVFVVIHNGAKKGLRLCDSLFSDSDPDVSGRRPVSVSSVSGRQRVHIVYRERAKAFPPEVAAPAIGHVHMPGMSRHAILGMWLFRNRLETALFLWTGQGFTH